ncbi:MAG: hypothetical protein KDF95_12090 [Rhodocyclaceae bacterium]|nr:hypothetical protein [Rhodocyclaceae bacterium]
MPRGGSGRRRCFVGRPRPPPSARLGDGLNSYLYDPVSLLLNCFTAITVAFDRGWPFVAYALALLLAGAFYYKCFCRFICPLGAVMSLGGKLRLWNWLARRSECGQPCQRCKSACRYDAIERSGKIQYENCFQCLDCVGIYHDAKRCVPVMLFNRKGVLLGNRV